MTEPDVTLTDYGLTLLCAFLAWRSAGVARPPIRPWLVAFFIGAAAAPLFGGTVHGFFEDAASLGNRILWPLTMLSIGATAVAAWGLGARVGQPMGAAPLLTRIVGVSFVAYAGVVLVGYQGFEVALVYYLPAAVFLLVRFVVAHRRAPTRARLEAIAGLGLTFAAAGIQAGRVPLHPEYFDHNALYHLVQAVAFVLFYRGASRESGAV